MYVLKPVAVFGGTGSLAVLVLWLGPFSTIAGIAAVFLAACSALTAALVVSRLVSAVVLRRAVPGLGCESKLERVVYGVLTAYGFWLLLLTFNQAAELVALSSAVIQMTTAVGVAVVACELALLAAVLQRKLWA